MAYYLKDLTGKQFNFLTVIERVNRGKKGKSFWLCKCDCGNETIVRSDALRNGTTKSCGCWRDKNNRGTIHHLWKGKGGIPLSWWNRKIAESIKRQEEKGRFLNSDLTMEEAWEKFQEQKGKCALTGMGINIGDRSGKNENTASIDRIDSAKGYTKSNIQWVHKDINRMKWELSQQRFIELCGEVTKYNEL